MHPVIGRFGKSVVIVDGGMGTLLQANGLMGGELPELWNLTHPEVLLKIQSDYVNAGCDILTANMFGANRLKLEKTGHTVQEVVSQALKLAHTASGGKAAVALDIGPSGKLLKPFGDLAFDDAYELFKEEIIAGRDNADLVIIETMSDAYEAKAALLAAKENCDLPVVVTFTFDSTGKLLTGSNIPAALLLAESLGADAVGINCSLGPEQMESFVDEMLTLTNLPIVINPNAGLPVSVNGETSYPVGPEQRGVKLIRVGLHASEELENRVAGPFHPAFMELCRSAIFRENVLKALQARNDSEVTIDVDPRMLSVALGQKKENLQHFSKHGYTVHIRPDASLSGGTYRLR